MPLTRFKLSAIADGGIETADLADDAVTSAKISDNIELSGTEAARMPVGTTAQRANAQSGDQRFNSTLSLMEYYDGTQWKSIDSPPLISSISPTTETDANANITITGSNFQSGATVKFVGNDGTEYNSPTVTVNSATEIVAQTPASALTVANEPYDVQVTNTSGLSGTLADALDAGSTPTWTTAAGNIGTIVEDYAISSLSIAATDADGQSVTISSSDFSIAGVTLNSDGTITGTPNVNDTYASGGVTHTFDGEASDGVNTATRTFNILRKWRDGSTSATAISSLSDFDAIATGDTGYNTRYVTLNGALSAFEMDTYTTSGGDTFYVVSPVFGLGGFDLLNDSVCGVGPGSGNGSFKTIVGSQTRTVSMSGNFSAFSSKTPYNIYTPNTPSTYVDTVNNIYGSGYQGETQGNISGDMRGGGRADLGFDTRLGYQTLNWYFHGTGGNASSGEITALRNIVTELSILTPWCNVTGDDDGTTASNSSRTITSNDDYDIGSTPAGHWLKDSSGNYHRMVAGVSSANEHMYVSMWTHNDFSHQESNSGNPSATYSGTLSNGLSTAGMILAAEYDARVGGTSTTVLGPAYSSETGFRNNRNPMLVR